MRNYSDEIVKHIEGCWKSEVDERTEWNFVTSTLYGFGIVTTLGYNRIAPITLTGRMFCILYGLCGIPVTMITIANVGRYLNTFAKNCKQKYFFVFLLASKQQPVQCFDSIADQAALSLIIA
ncbi:unnamed protein product [Gongylonema pulchrum]|uniref:Ion_trans_2 domain-containing protein n=1 Tax=Gongylonema pulchrum TaxID=637853 RepID=A0A183EKD7_9BILA|nr:unnamed protein product [Gongylonema pulchrum]